ncbi:hypothetical protein JCM19379_17660 [Methyloparacoccus murrellii]
MRHPTIMPLCCLAFAALLAGCASDKPLPPPQAPKPLSGEQILRESQGMAQLGQRYKEGESMAQEGEKLIEQANQQIAEGRRLIDEGRRIMQEAEQGYGAIKQ